MARTSSTPQTSRQRLADISHHFLTEPDALEEAAIDALLPEEDREDDYNEQTVADHQPESPTRKTLTFAVIAHDSGFAKFPMFQMCEQLTVRGWSTAIIDTQQEQRAISFISRNYRKHCITVHQGPCVNAIEEITREAENTIHDAHFRIVDASMSEELVSAHRIILPINLSEAGSEPVQKLIGDLYERDEEARINIVLTDSPDTRMALRGFNRLSSHSQFILDQEPEYLGHLPSDADNVDHRSTCQHLIDMTERLSNTIADRGRVLFRESTTTN